MSINENNFSAGMARAHEAADLLGRKIEPTRPTPVIVGDVVGRTAPLALLTVAAFNVDGWLRFCIVAWLAFVVLMYIGLASMKP